MADLTVLSPLPVPLYPSLPGASRSSLFKTFIPGASSSRFSLTSLATDLPFTSPRTTTTRAEGCEDDGEVSEDGNETDSSSCSSSNDSCEGSLSREGSMATEECESPATVSDGTWDAFYNDKEPQTARPSNESSFPQNNHSQASLSPLSRGRSSYQRHRPTRSQSAPPFKTTFSQEDGETTPRTAYTPNASQIDFEHHNSRSQRRSRTTYSDYSSSSELSSPSRSVASAPWAAGYGQTRGGQLPKPPPPLHRPTTFWRRTPRSGVTSSSYSPSSHLIRRSTFVAAGLPFDKPMADLSALGVESRVRSKFAEERAAKVQDMFWEVVLPR
ncbi:hypothetical protein Moror_3081 [Moniliophthora roreri MCA 2997]|uniref:Uncharacterized protein n=2 Tax=Moniliophthora roreri TaxID=221103 RepID=V2X4B7_MONRO|nr:hypothetical protein Moror_3081 [Moniliophthora roreri MCA 2997]KAI3605883.1 hypothetical protein WG66_012374 [Moniliophthora roreri]